MLRVGLTLSADYISIALADNSRIRTTLTHKTTGNLTRDVEDILQQITSELRKSRKKLSSASIITNAVRRAIEGEGELERVALFRLSAPEGLDSPPLLDAEVAKRTLADFFVINGGHGFDGRIIGSLNVRDLEEHFRKTSAKAFVISSPFSILFPDQENATRNHLVKMGAKKIWTSIDVSSQPSIMDREVTAVLSAATSGTIKQVATLVRSALSNHGWSPEIYFGKNDGSIIGSQLAERFPLETAWGIEGHSTAGAAKIIRSPKCLVVGKNGKQYWLTGVKDKKPEMRKVSYIRNMRLHVASPFIIMGHSDSELPQATGANFQLMSEFIGTKLTYSSGPLENFEPPFQITRHPESEALSAINSTQSNIFWRWTISVAKGSDFNSAEQKLTKKVREQMRQSMGTSCKFGKIVRRVATNLPDGSVMMSLDASGVPI